MDSVSKMISDLRLGMEDLSQDSFKKIFTHIDQLSIKQSVDRMGLDKFIESCARMAAVSGAVTGGGGVITMAVGIPFDMLNLISQQIRVSFGIIYYYRGTYQVTLDEFLSILAVALQIEAGIAITKGLLERGSERIMIRLGTRAASRMIPVIGGAIGGV